MSGVGGRKLLVVVAVFGALAVGAGAAYALTPAPAERAVMVEAPDGTQPTTDAQVDASSAAASSAPPSSAAAVSPSASVAAVPAPAAVGVAGCETGEQQREVETYLAQIGGYGEITVDGQQSPVDCATIIKFQTRFGISPASGRAGPTTADVARRISISLTAQEQAKCAAGPGMTACVDLTLQTMWVVRDGVVVFAPTVVRTGMPGHATPTGTYKVYDRNVNAWSVPFKVWLPYWQNFNAGMGFHATTTYIHTLAAGSHGCVNLLYGDARTLYNTTTMNTPVQVFGHRAGT